MSAEVSDVIVVNEVQLGEGFVEASFAGLTLIIHAQDGSTNATHQQEGFINATHLCKLMGKALYRYNEPERRKDMKDALTSFYGDEGTKKVNAKHDQRLLGTYFHPALLLDLAAWLAPETYVGAAVIIDVFFNRTDQRKLQLRRLFPGEGIAYKNLTPDQRKLQVRRLLAGEGITISYKNQTPNWRIQYQDYKQLVNERGWFRAKDFCVAVDVDDLEKQKSNAALRKYFEELGQSHGAFYHPLLFLRLVSWLNVNVYGTWVGVVFCCEETRLKALFRDAIATAGFRSVAYVDKGGRSSSNWTNGQLSAEMAGPSTHTVSNQRAPSTSSGLTVAATETSESVIAPDPPLIQPSTSSGRTDFDRSQSMNFVYDDGDDDVGNSAMDEGPEANGMMLQVEHQILLDRERRRLQEQIERERDEKNAALERERQKEAALSRVEEEKRRKVEEYNALLEEFENLQIRESKYREKLRKRPHEDANGAVAVANGAAANAGNAIPTDASIPKLECLVLFVVRGRTVYCCRRQLRGIFSAIYKQSDDITEFVGWYLTKSAIYDFNFCKQLVGQKAADCGRNLKVHGNEMDLDPGEHQFDLQATICNTLRLELKVLEADVNVLARLFGKPVRCGSFVADSDPAKAQLVERVHKWVEEQFVKFMKIRA